NNPEVEGIVAGVVSEQFGKYLEENPKEAQKIMKKVILAAEAREAAAKAKKDLKQRKNILSSGGLPGKLYDCTTRDRDESELFQEGHVYVARPPLYKVSQKKNIRYVQTMEEMNTDLMGRGLSGTKLTVEPPPATEGAPPAAATFEGDRLKKLVQVLGELEDAL